MGGTCCVKGDKKGCTKNTDCCKSDWVCQVGYCRAPWPLSLAVGSLQAKGSDKNIDNRTLTANMNDASENKYFGLDNHHYAAILISFLCVALLATMCSFWCVWKRCCWCKRDGSVQEDAKGNVKGNITENAEADVMIPKQNL